MRYRNGNYYVTIYDDGTKIRETEADSFIPAFAENCDVKITNCCDGNCSYCYEGCTKNGKHGDILNLPFYNTLHPYTELAINGNDLTHPDLVTFLKYMKNKKILVNMTVNQQHFEKNIDFLQNLTEQKLINGLGISLVSPTEHFIQKVQLFSNAVIHVINGIITYEDIEMLACHNLKLLILGYKQLKRGSDYYKKNERKIIYNQEYLYQNLAEIIKDFNVVSFDNLAIKQLDVQRLFNEEEWSEFYMGDDGKYTFYIDLVEKVFAKNSLSQTRYPLLDNIDDMFIRIKSES